VDNDEHRSMLAEPTSFGKSNGGIGMNFTEHKLRLYFQQVVVRWLLLI